MDTEDTSPNPFTHPRFVVAAVVVALIGILAVAVVVANAVGGSEEPAEPLPENQNSGGQHALESDSVCGLSGAGQEIPEEPPEASWETVGTTLAPSIPQEGPGVIDDDGFRSCYAPTPTGALLAAANFLALGTDPTIAQRIPEELLAEGPGRDAALEGVQERDHRTGVRFELQGFRLLDFHDGSARIDLAMRTSQDAYVSLVYDLVWEDGDWKFVTDDQGGPLFDPVELATLNDYTAWSGE